MPLKTITIKKVYTKSALETMPEVLEALSTALCSATADAVASGGRYGTGWPGEPVDERAPWAGHCRYAWPA